jgi:quinol-cytochrome oxidoreductase complex cytochrome b subunit
MTFYYRPSVVDAFASVEYIMTSVNFGWLIRSIHRWSASMMVRAIRSWMNILLTVMNGIQGEDTFVGQYAKA